MVSIMPPDPDSKRNPRPPTLAGVADMMSRSGVPFTREVSGLISYIAAHHEHPVTCGECSDGQNLPCLLLENATSVAFAWLLELVDERG